LFVRHPVGGTGQRDCPTKKALTCEEGTMNGDIRDYLVDLAKKD
jgi:hypothetical protein